MQKKLLASLLMVPMAYSAFANINVPVGGDWEVAGNPGDGYKYDEATESLSWATIGTGYISQEIKNVAPGSYTLAFAKQENVKVELSVNGEPLTTKISEDGNSRTFEITAAMCGGG